MRQRASRSSSWHSAGTRGQPWSAWNWMAAGTERQAAGSRVPCHSCSSMNRDLAPCSGGIASPAVPPPDLAIRRGRQWITIPPPAHHQRLEQVLHLPARVQERAPRRTAQPLVAVYTILKTRSFGQLVSTWIKSGV